MGVIELIYNGDHDIFYGMKVVLTPEMPTEDAMTVYWYDLENNLLHVDIVTGDNMLPLISRLERSGFIHLLERKVQNVRR